MSLPPRVQVVEVGPRDGFQMESAFIPTDLKVEVVDLLASAGLLLPPPLPAWADAVIPIEQVHLVERPPAIVILAAVAPWSNVRSMGEDMVATELVLPANHTLRPVDLGAIAGLGALLPLPDDLEVGGLLQPLQ